MSFKNKTDYFGLGNDNIQVVADSDGRSKQTVSALKENGSYAIIEAFGERLAPTNTYKIKGAVENVQIVLGGISTVGTKKIMLGSVTIGTSAGGEVTFTASGQEVESGATTGCKYQVTIPALSPKRHVQDILNAYTLSGTGCHVTSNTYTMTTNIGISTKDGVPLASDVTEGQITVNVDVVSTVGQEPELTPSEGWILTSPLAQTNPDAGYATYSATLTKILEKA